MVIKQIQPYTLKVAYTLYNPLVCLKASLLQGGRALAGFLVVLRTKQRMATVIC